MVPRKERGVLRWDRANSALISQVSHLCVGPSGGPCGTYIVFDGHASKYGLDPGLMVYSLMMHPLVPHGEGVKYPVPIVQLKKHK
jgi:hypothetical protein